MPTTIMWKLCRVIFNKVNIEDGCYTFGSVRRTANLMMLNFFKKINTYPKVLKTIKKKKLLKQST